MRIQILTDGPGLRSGVPVAAVLAVCFIAVSGPALANKQTKQFCKEFLNWGESERVSWYAEIDSAIYESFEESKDLNWSESQLASYAECQRESQTAFGLKIEEACKAGMRNMSVIGEISGQRTTACVNQVTSGEVDPDSEPDAALQADVFCEEFLQWGPAERTSWYAEIDSTAFESLEESTDLNWSESHLSLAKACLQETRVAFGVKIAESCRAGMRDLSVIGEIAGPRMKACIKMTFTGELDPEWGSHAALQVEQFCEEFLQWGPAKRTSWYAENDAEIYETFKASSDWSEDQLALVQDCLQETRAASGLKIEEACTVGGRDVNVIELFRPRIKACMKKVITGELDPEWGSNAALQAKQFCPDWSKWGADERAAFLRKGDDAGLRVIERHEASPEQRTEFVECLAASGAVVTERLDGACREAISYLDAINVLSAQATICARRTGIDVE